MKRMKFGVLWAALVSMLGFTSCLDGGDNSNIQNFNEIMKIDKLTGLYVSQMGYKVNPLNAGDLQGVPSTSGYIQLHYTYDYTQDMSDGEIDATIYGYSTISEGLWMPQAPTEADSGAPVSGVEVTSSDATYFFYKLDDMLQGDCAILRIGRKDEGVYNDIAIVEENSSYISRKHCTLELDYDIGSWVIRDGQWDRYETGGWKRSTNGTYVNSQEVTINGLAFSPGDIISIGDTKLRVEAY